MQFCVQAAVSYPSAPHILLFCIFCLYFCAGNATFPNWIVLWIDIQFSTLTIFFSTERYWFPSVNAALSTSHSVWSQTALFRFKEANYKTLTNISVRCQMQTEFVRKFAGSTDFGFCPSATWVTDCVELDCVSDVWLTVHRNSAWIRKTN